MYFDPVDGGPQVGSHRRSLLGVRPTGAFADIDLNPPGDMNGDVVRNGKGLSVSADWQKLPGHLIPEERDDGLNGASGKGMKIFVHGTGGFNEGPVSPALEMVFKPQTIHDGVVCPTAAVSLNQFQSDLQATRLQWVEHP